MSNTADGRLGRRLRRILLLLPYAIKHPGVSIDELSAKFGVKKKDLLEDLNLVFMCGLPGYGPGDLIDVSLEEDRVYVRMADYFGQPFRLTPAEALALYAGASALAELPEMEEADALRSALGKLARAIGMDEEKGPGIEVRIKAAPHEHLETVQDALKAGRKIAMTYFSAARGVMTERTIEPWSLLAVEGHWYLVAGDDLSGDERFFRVDRIKEATILDERAEVPEDLDLARYTTAFVGDPTNPSVNFEISPDVARWFEDAYLARSSRELEDGWWAIEMEASGRQWITALLVQLGSGVRNIEPSEYRDAAVELAKEIAEAHA